MTAKEKAEDLFRACYEKISGIPKDKTIFYVVEDHSIKAAIQCALISVTEIEDALTNYGAMSNELQNMDSEWRFWQSVRDALNNL